MARASSRARQSSSICSGVRSLCCRQSCASSRGDWVDAPLSANQYKSDFDVLIIVNQKELADRATYWSKAEERLIREYLIEKTLRTPVNFIVHSLQEVNDGLAHGRVFFMEVAKEGIALYVVQNCTPYNHNIAFLRIQAERPDRRMIGIWPEASRKERAMFQKLKEAYTKARYSRHYRISEEELGWLGERVEELGQVVHQICSEKIVELTKAAAATH